MNGGVTRHEAMMMSAEERLEHLEYINAIIQKKAKALTGQELM